MAITKTIADINFTNTAGSLLLLTVMMLVLVLSSLAIGAVPISYREILSILGEKLGMVADINETQQMVLLNIRAPRVLITLFVGAALGISGAALQGLFRNPLVEPGIIGVSSGAAVGAITIIMFLGTIAPLFVVGAKSWLMPLFAFGGSLISTFIALNLSRFQGKTQITYLLLAGVAVTSLAGALIGLSIFYADDTQLRTYTFWTLGDLSVATWDKLQILIPMVAVSVLGLITLARPLNVMSLGESEAFHSGVQVEQVKILTVILSALAVGTSVAFTGIIGFVGLVVPHIIRISFSSDHTLVLPASAIGGACLLLLADIFARTVVSPAELPIGVVTAIIGTPFFIYLLINAKKKNQI